MSTIMTQRMQHEWVKHTITKVSTVPDPEDDCRIVVFEDPMDTQEAAEEAVYGCDRCGASMAGNTDTLCDPLCHCGMLLSEHEVTSNHDFKEMSS